MDSTNNNQESSNINNGSKNFSLSDHAENDNIVNFGPTFFIDRLLNGIGYDINVLPIFNIFSPVSVDIIKALIIYKLGYGEAYNKLDIWYRQNVISSLYPNLNFSSQRISKYLRHIGSLTLKLNFMRAHINFVKSIYNLSKLKLSFDSTTFDNKCYVHISKPYESFEDKDKSFRMLVAMHIPTGLPVYYDLFPVDVVTQGLLRYTMELLRLSGFQVEHLAGDAEISQISTINKLIFLDSLDSFIIRINSNHKIVNNLVKNEVEKLYNNDCMHLNFNNRSMRASKSYIDFKDPDNKCDTKKAYVYIYLYEDILSKKISELKENLKSTDQIIDELIKNAKDFGILTLMSSRDITPVQALNEYHSISNEHFYDILKHDFNLSPVNLHSRDNLYGHILLCFLATFFYILIERRLKLFKFSHINISPKYTNILECDPVSDIKNDIMEQNISEELAKTTISDFFYELQSQNANVHVENQQLDNATKQVTTIIPYAPSAQSELYYKDFGLATPEKIVYSGDKINIHYDKDKPKDNIKQLAFADRLCQYDLKRLQDK